MVYAKGKQEAEGKFAAGRGKIITVVRTSLTQQGSHGSMYICLPRGNH